MVLHYHTRCICARKDTSIKGCWPCLCRALMCQRHSLAEHHCAGIRALRSSELLSCCLPCKQGRVGGGEIFCCTGVQFLGPASRVIFRQCVSEAAGPGATRHLPVPAPSGSALPPLLCCKPSGSQGPARRPSAHLFEELLQLS